jgi:hypothetical protein
VRVQVIDHEGMGMPVPVPRSAQKVRVIQRKVAVLVLYHLGIVGGPERLGEQNSDQRDGSKHCKGRRQRGFGAKPTGKGVSYEPAGM